MLKSDMRLVARVYWPRLLAEKELIWSSGRRRGLWERHLSPGRLMGNVVQFFSNMAAPRWGDVRVTAAALRDRLERLVKEKARGEDPAWV